MKVLILNGSPHVNGTTKIAINEAVKTLNEEGIETEVIEVGSKSIVGCKGCFACYKLGKCAIDDLVNETNEKFKEADGLIIASPVYYATPNGTLLSFLDRLFYSKRFDTSMKVGAAIACARRAGTSTTFDCLNKYFTISEMPVVGGRYWNNVFGQKNDEGMDDLEGLQNIRAISKNMAFLIKSINLGKEAYGLPEKEKKVMTNFIKR